MSSELHLPQRSALNISDPFAIADAVKYRDPFLAYHVLNSRARPKSYQMTFTFNEGVKGKSVDGSMANKINCDFIAYDLAYTIRRPLFLADQLAIKSQADWAFLTVPYMSIWLEVDGCPEMPITDELQPLETICRPVNQPRSLIIEPFPFVIPGMETLRARVYLDKDFDSETEHEVPMELIVTMYGYALTCHQYDRINLDMEDILEGEWGLNKFYGMKINRAALLKQEKSVLEEMAGLSRLRRDQQEGEKRAHYESKRTPRIYEDGKK